VLQAGRSPVKSPDEVDFFANDLIPVTGIALPFLGVRIILKLILRNRC
jgi:hypothetical protein